MSTDRTTFLAVVRILGGALLTATLAIAVLAGLGRAVPDILPTLAVGCLTGLAGLLARPTDSSPVPVQVRQPDGAPVPVEPVPESHPYPAREL